MPMDTDEISALVGRKCTWLVPGRVDRPDTGNLSFTCRIKSARVNFGRTEVKIAPISGDGARWVKIANVELL